MKRAENLWQSFRYAFRGLGYAIASQRNMRIHLAAASLMLGLGWLLRLPASQFLAVLLAITVVLVAEMVNTAVETVVDLASPEYHRLAEVAKDVAAGAVLIAALGAAAVGADVFLPRVGELPMAIVLQLSRHPWPLIGLLVGWGIVGGLLVWAGPRGLDREGG